MFMYFDKIKFSKRDKKYLEKKSYYSNVYDVLNCFLILIFIELFFKHIFDNLSGIFFINLVH